jgi:hypothetical protein
MRRLVTLLLLSILSGLLLTATSAQRSARRTRKASAPPIICTIASVPKGMVVVGYKRNSACSNGAELIVKRPANGDIICAESPLPPQFSIVTEAQGDSTGTCPKKAFLISGSASRTASGSHTTALNDDSIRRAFASRATNIEVEGQGTVSRLLPDDLNAPRHQRFIVELASGQTLLMTHNIDIAPRINGLEAGDVVSFKGEYVWNEKGGVIHWTHHDPQNRHIAGWILHNGKRYQ